MTRLQLVWLLVLNMIFHPLTGSRIVRECRSFNWDDLPNTCLVFCFFRAVGSHIICLSCCVNNIARTNLLQWHVCLQCVFPTLKPAKNWVWFSWWILLSGCIFLWTDSDESTHRRRLRETFCLPPPAVRLTLFSFFVSLSGLLICF